jgi:hypothetical protein
MSSSRKIDIVQLSFEHGLLRDGRQTLAGCSFAGVRLLNARGRNKSDFFARVAMPAPGWLIFSRKFAAGLLFPLANPRRRQPFRVGRGRSRRG